MRLSPKARPGIRLGGAAVASRSTLPSLFLACFLTATLVALLGSPSATAEAREAEAPAVWALTHARVVTAPGRVLDDATVVIRDGLIEAVGTGLQAPPDARIEDFSGLTVYPGLIDAYAERSWPEESHPPQGSHDNPQVRPERDLALYGHDAGFAKQRRKAGITTALVASAEGVLRGSSALINLGDGGLEHNLLLGAAAQHASLEAAEGRDYPNSTMGAVALARQSFLDARWYRRARAAWEADPGQPRIPYSRSLEALGPAAHGESPVFFTASDVNAVGRAADLATELNLQAVLVGNGHEYQQLPALQAAGFPLILPLSFPEAPEVGDEGPAAAVALAELRHWDQAAANPARVLGAELTIAFTTHGLDKPAKIFPALAKAREHGLTEDQILAAWTTVPARLLGLEDRLGTLDAGKWANLLVVEGELWTDEPKLQEVWIDGRRYSLEDDGGGGDKAMQWTRRPPSGIGASAEAATRAGAAAGGAS
ncbi:MAG: amidohydrolase family protein [Acidobacteriota bacterium]|nr:amidohydrolase family protein [Acidobacteriota bacterium]